MTDSVALPTYLLTISLTYCLCIYWVFIRAKQSSKINPTLALDVCLAIMIGGLIGARGFHIFYENFDYYREYPMDVFKLWQGGFVFYGGFLGALLTTILFLRIRKEAFWPWADFMAPVLALGYALGRIACFLNGCCFGRECNLPWAVEFNFTGLPTGLRHPSQLYATLWELGVMALILILENKKNYFKFTIIRTLLNKPGHLFLTWLFLHAIGRLFMEYFRDDYRGEAYFGISISSWMSVVVLISVIILFWRRIFSRHST